MPALVITRSAADLPGGRGPQFIAALVNVVCVMSIDFLDLSR